jgi:NAD(P)H dehydrogenase (quinone)
MNVLVILAHPNKTSFNHAIAKTAVARLQENGHEVTFHDLYEEQFDPILPDEEIPKDGVITSDVEKHCQELSSADGIVIVHPNWWGQPPAILKGWVDRIFRPGVAYEFEEEDSGEGVPIGLLKAKAALVFNTSNTPIERELAVFGDPLEVLWKTCIFDLCGVKTFVRKMFTVIVTSTLEQRKKWLQEVEEMVDTYFPASKEERNT